MRTTKLIGYALACLAAFAVGALVGVMGIVGYGYYEFDRRQQH